MESAIDALRSCEYLYLGAISEPGSNDLCIEVLEARVGEAATEADVADEQDERLRSLLLGSSPIEHFDDCRTFSLYWSTYICYGVVNESYSSGEPETRKGKGRLLVEYENSNFLDYLAVATFATEDYPGPYRHWAIQCLNRTIDVASQVQPVVRELRRS